MRRQSEAKGLFDEMVNRGDEEVVLAEAALLFAKEIEYPDLDIEKYLRKVDLMALEIKGRVEHTTDPYHLINKINNYLFDDEGFHGNENDYNDPRNSFLSDVLDRKTGIPITLSLLYIEIGYRLGLPISGVGFPGHFIVKYQGAGREILIDPFNRGRIVSHEDCQEILENIYGSGVELEDDFLKPVTHKQILDRMLHNLKNIYLSSQNHVKALIVVDLILLLDPDALNELRDRGLIFYKLECFIQALYDLQTYLRRSPYAEDGESVRQLVLELKNLVSQIN